jgi:hypothetical protein
MKAVSIEALKLSTDRFALVGIADLYFVENKGLSI